MSGGSTGSYVQMLLSNSFRDLSLVPAGAARRLAAVQAAQAADAELGAASQLQAGPSDVCSTDSRRTNWGMTLSSLKPSQAFVSADKQTVIRQCFVLNISNECSDAGESDVSCCHPGLAPDRLVIRVDLPACGFDSLRSLRWSVDEEPLRFSVTRPGYLMFSRLPAWSGGQKTKELCVNITQDLRNTSSCNTLKQLCVGKWTCKYRLYGAASNGAAAFSGTGTATSSCCFQGYTLDEQLKSAAVLQSSFSALLAAAEQLRAAVKKGDPEAAAVAMQVPKSSYAEAVPLSGEDVLLQAELPSEFNASKWNSPVKSQGSTTMSASYAAVAAAEAAYLALELAAKGSSATSASFNNNIRFSEKALHWCDSAAPLPEWNTTSPGKTGWDARSAMATLVVKGAVYNSCYSDPIAYQYSEAAAGDLGGSCGSVLAACSRWKQLEYVDLTPTKAGDLKTIQKHIQQYYAVVAEIVMYSDMEAQLQFRQQRDGDVWLNPQGAGGIAVSVGEAGGAVKRYGHYIVITGWNFSSPDPKEHYWLVKDSLPGQGMDQYWKLAAQSPAGFGSWVGGFVKKGTANRKKRRHDSKTATDASAATGAQPSGNGKLVSLIASFADNFFALKGNDLACLPPGTQLEFCSANSAAAAFAFIRSLGR
eukprot:gene11759-11905_t